MKAPLLKDRLPNNINPSMKSRELLPDDQQREELGFDREEEEIV